MITRKNIEYLYDRYQVNVVREKNINSMLLQAGDQEAWLDSLRTKSHLLRIIYSENEAMLNLYMRPLLDQQNLLNDDLADEIFIQLGKAAGNEMNDRLICVEAGIMIRDYYKKKHDTDRWIAVSHFLGTFYNMMDGAKSAQRCLEVFDEQREMFKDYALIENWDTRRRILFSFYNYAVVLLSARPYNEHFGGKKEYERQLLLQYDRAVSVYDDETVRKLDGDRYDIDGLKKDLMYDVLGNWICGSDDRDDAGTEIFERCAKVIEEQYESALKDNGDIFEMDDQLYCNYQKAQYILGKISRDEYSDRVMAYCDNVIKSPDWGDEYLNSRYYSVNMYHVVNLASLVRKDDSPEYKRRLADYVLPRFSAFISALPKDENIYFVNEALIRGMQAVIHFFGTDSVNVRYYLELLINRDESLMFHSRIVSKLAERIVRTVFDEAPGLMTGILGTSSELEVLEKRQKIEEIVSQSSWMFDIGKIGLSGITMMQRRRLVEDERCELQSHVTYGYKMLKEMGFCEEVCEAALGHHRSYDSKSGYPLSFDLNKSSVKFVIDLIKICDCMAAATDDIGRVYARPKSFSEFEDELRAGAGYLYNPDIVNLIISNRELYSDLEYQCSAGRIAVYYEAYNTLVKGDKAAARHAVQRDGANIKTDELYKLDDGRNNLFEDMQEVNREQRQVIKSLTKSSLLIARISLKEDAVDVFYNANDGLLKDVKNESFTGFVNDFCMKAVHEEDYPKLSLLLDYGKFSDMLLAGDGSFEIELRMKSESGDWSWRRFGFVLAEENNQTAEVAVVTVTDIDSTRKKQWQVKEALDLSYKQAKQASAAKSEFLANISHDIRTPMNIILGMTQIARKNQDNAGKLEDCLQKIEDASEHLLGLINEVLDMSKIESGKLELNERETAVRGLMEGIFSIMHANAEKKNLEFTFMTDDLPDDVVICDPVRVREVVINLITNAIKYTPSGGKVFVCASRDGIDGIYGNYRFIVRDTGIGMTEEFQKRIFAPFARDEQVVVSEIQGTGLGLSITKSIVDIMHGTISVESRLGSGSVFEVVLPMKVIDESAAKKEPEEKIDLQRFEGYFAGKRILVAEDNELNREIFVELLKFTGVSIDEAENGMQAVKMVAQNPEDYYDMVFMDLQMPVMNGLDAARQIRKLDMDYVSRLPIVALTASAFSEDGKNTASAGMNEHLAKPVEVWKLISSMLKWIK